AFEVPSNLVLERVGARLWIGRIMISWGLITAATAWVTGPASFLAARFLLGAAEAGFVPGLLLYITYWFPPRYRAGATAVLFFFAMAMYGVSLFLPLILSGAGLSNRQVGFAATVPFAAAGIGAVIWGWHSDRRNERHWHTLSAMLLAAICLALVPLLGASLWSL